MLAYEKGSGNDCAKAKKLIIEHLGDIRAYEEFPVRKWIWYWVFRTQLDVFYASEKMDITPEVIKVLNIALKKIDLFFKVFFNRKVVKLLLEISELLEWIPEAVTDGNCNISSIKGLASLNKAQTGDLSFLANPKYRHFVPKTNASVVILHEDYEGLPQKEQMFLRSKNPSHCLAKICRKIHQKTFAQPKPG